LTTRVRYERANQPIIQAHIEARTLKTELIPPAFPPIPSDQEAVLDRLSRLLG
jgi:hypothetical protein